MKNIELNLNDLELVTGGKLNPIEAEEKYHETLEKIDTLKSGYHGDIKRGTQVYSVLRGYKKEARKYKRQSKR